MENENTTITDEVLDSAWGDEDGVESAADQQQDTTTNTAGNEPAADQPKQETPPTQEGQQADPPATPELFTLKNRDETRQVTRDELVAMAQKGWDYDTVRAERDQLRQYKQEADPAFEVIKGYAQRNNMTVPDYLDFCRKQELMRGGLDEKAADQTLQMEKRKADLDAQEARINADKLQRDSLLQQAKARQEAQQKDMNAFLRAYPDVKAESIPQEVWAQVAQGDSLVNAYTMHENKRLTAELAAERQNKANQARTPGSLGGNSGAEMDEIDRLWSEDD